VLIATDLPEPVGTGDQQMRHARKIDDHRLAADGLAKRRSAGASFEFSKSRKASNSRRQHGFALGVRQFDADGVAARHHRRRALLPRSSSGRYLLGEADDAGRTWCPVPAQARTV